MTGEIDQGDGAESRSEAQDAAETLPTLPPRPARSARPTAPIGDEEDDEETGVEPVVPVQRRICWRCRGPVGRDPGETEGVCGCGTPFSFGPPLVRGDWVARDDSGGRTTGYEIMRVLGVGGFGWTFQAWDHGVRRRVVVKLAIDPADPEGDELAEREGRELAAVRHPGLLTVFAMLRRRHPLISRYVEYIVMEYLSGRSLEDRVRAAAGGTGPPLGVIDVCDAYERVLDALHHLHRARRTYNDPSPDNIMVTDDHRVVMVDLGAVTPAGVPLGSTQGKEYRDDPRPSDLPVDAATDLHVVARGMIWALAALAPDRFVDPWADPTTARAARTPADAPVDAGFTGVFPDDPLALLVHRALTCWSEPAPDRFTAGEMADRLRHIRRELAGASTASASVVTPLLAVAPAPETSLFERWESAPHGCEEDGAPAAHLDLVAATLALPRPRVARHAPDGALLESFRLEPAALRLHLLEDLRDTRSQEAASPGVDLDLETALTRVELGLRDLPELSRLDREAGRDPRVAWVRGLWAAAVHADQAEARDCFRSVLRDEPGEQVPKLALGHLARMAGRAADALSHYGRAWAGRRSLVTAAYGLAWCRLHEDEPERASEILDAVPADPRYRDLTRCGAVVVLGRQREPSASVRTAFFRRAESLSWSSPLSFTEASARASIVRTAQTWHRARHDGLPATVFGHPCDASGLRRALSEALDAQAESADDVLRARELRAAADATRPFRLLDWLGAARP